jgi:hypothetical protein
MLELFNNIASNSPIAKQPKVPTTANMIVHPKTGKNIDLKGPLKIDTKLAKPIK